MPNQRVALGIDPTGKPIAIRLTDAGALGISGASDAGNGAIAVDGMLLLGLSDSGRFVPLAVDATGNLQVGAGSGGAGTTIIQYLENNYYDQNFIDNNYYDQDFVDNNFFTQTYITNNFISNTLITLKGQLIGGKGNHDVGVVPVGTNGFLLKADSTQVTGLNWVDPAGVDTAAIPKSLVDAKGDILAGTADNTVARVPAGTNGYALIARSGATPGIAWEQQLVVVPFIIDGGGSAITTGIKGDFEIPFSGTIVAARLLADQSGSIVVDLYKAAYASLPPTGSITASAKPTLSSAQKSENTTLTGWTTTVTAGDWIRVNVDSITTVQRVTLSLTIAKT